MVVAYVVAHDEYSIKAKLENSLTELTKKDPMFVWTRVNGENMKDVGKIDLNTLKTEFIEEPINQSKSLHKPIVFFQGIPRNITC